MWEEISGIMKQAVTQTANQIAHFLPGVVVSLALLMVTVILAALVRSLLARALRGLDVDHRAEQFGLSMLADWSPSGRPSQVIARGVQWTILVLGLLVALTALDATMPSRFAMAVFEYFPHLLAALLILVVGSLAARFLARSMLISAVNLHIQSARLLSLSTKWMVITITVAMALDQLGIGRSIFLLAFGSLFGGIVLALALAIGLGAKDMVGRALERQFRDSRNPDRLDHV